MKKEEKIISIESCGLASFALLNSLIKELIDQGIISQEQREEIIIRAESEVRKAGEKTTTTINSDASYLLSRLLIE